VARRCVWYRNLANEEALAHWRLSRKRQTKLNGVIRPLYYQPPNQLVY
jgi:hypothetical protein